MNSEARCRALVIRLSFMYIQTQSTTHWKPPLTSGGLMSYAPNNRTFDIVTHIMKHGRSVRKVSCPQCSAKSLEGIAFEQCLGVKWKTPLSSDRFGLMNLYYKVFFMQFNFLCVTSLKRKGHRKRSKWQSTCETNHNCWGPNSQVCSWSNFTD